jgi:hypothetical protein
MAWKNLVDDTPAADAPPPTGGWKNLVDTPDLQPAQVEDDLSWADEAYNVVLAMGTGVSSGIEAAGSLMEVAGITSGEGVRKSAQEWTQYLTSNMDDQWQEAINKSWLDLSAEGGAVRDPRSWAAGIAQTVPYMLGTGGLGAGIRGGLALGGRAAAKAGAERTATALGAAEAGAFPAAGGIVGAGDAAAGAGQAADDAGLPDDERLTAMRVAAPVGAAAGAVLGGKVEGILSGGKKGGVIRRLGQAAGAGVVGEGVEEGGTQAGTELGKASVGLDPSLTNILEATVGGAALGGPAAAVVSIPGAVAGSRAETRKANAAEALALSIKEAETAEKDRIEADIVAKREASRAQALDNSLKPPSLPPVPSPVVERDLAGQPIDPNYMQAGATEDNPDATFGKSLAPKMRANLNLIERKIGELTPEVSRLAEVFKSEPDMTKSGAKKLKAEFDKTTTNLNKLMERRRIFLDRAITERDTRLAKEKQAAFDADESRQSVLPDLRFPPNEPALFPELSPEGAPVYPSPTANLDADNVKSAVEDLPEESSFVDDPRQTSIDPVIEASVARSQRARSAAVARWEKARAERNAAEPSSPAPSVAAPALPAATPQVSAATSAATGAEGAAVRSIRIKPTSTRPPAPVGDTATAAPPPSAPSAPVLEPTSPLATPVPIPGAVVSATADSSAPPDLQPVQVEAEVGFRHAAPTQTATDATVETAGAPTTATPSPTAAAPAPPSEAAAVTPKRAANQRTGRPLGKMTASERLRMVLVGKGAVPADTVLAALQDAYSAEKNPNVINLIRRLRSFMKIADREGRGGFTVANAPLKNGFQGFFIPTTNAAYVNLDTAEDPVHVVMHELIHAATIGVIRTNPNASNGILTIMKDAMRQWELVSSEDTDAIRGFGGIEEFIAEALSNPIFADQLSQIYTGKRPSIWSRFVNSLGFRLSMRRDPGVSNLFDKLLEYIPNGAFLQSGNRQEIVAQTEALGLSDPVGFLSSQMRANMRANALAAMSNFKSRRVLQNMLKFYTVEQMARSYGWIGEGYEKNGVFTKLKNNSINRFYQFISERGGYAAKIRATAANIVNQIKNAVQTPGAMPYLTNLIFDARMWSIHPDLAATHPANQFGTNLPGGMAAWQDLNARWNSPAMTQAMKDSYSLMRDYAVSQRDDVTNQLMAARVRMSLGAEFASKLEDTIYDRSRIRTVTHGGVEVSWAPPLRAAELTTIVSTNFGVGTTTLTAAQKADITTKLSEVQSALGKEQGPYIPLRRSGSHYSVVRTAPVTVRNMAKSALDALIVANRTTQDGRLHIIEANRTAAGSNTYNVKYEYITVTSHDTERAASNATEEARQEFARYGRTNVTSVFGLTSNMSASIAGLQGGSIDSLRKVIADQFSGAAGELISRKILDYYLERLPETSIRKNQLGAKKIAGADRDLLNVFANFAQGSSYTAAQMRYGHKLARILNTEIREDAKELQSQAGTDKVLMQQAADLVALGNHLSERDQQYEALTAAEVGGRPGWVSSIWAKTPQIAGAWLLTGPGTAITNLTQPIVVGLPHFASEHSWSRVAAEFGRAYTDLIPRAVRSTIKEGVEFTTKLPKAVADIRRNQPVPSYKDPTTPFFRQITAGLSSAEEKDMVQRQAEAKKIDFGLVADLQSLAEGTSRGWTAVQHLSDGAFILPQAIETVNRTVTALMSYRLNKPLFITPGLTGQALAEAAAALDRKVSEDIDRTQINYAQENKAMAFQGEARRAMLTFKTYPQAMLYTVLHNMMQLWNPRTKADRKKAAIMLGGLFGFTALASGMIGLLALDPFYAVIATLLTVLTDEDDIETFLRKNMVEFNDTFTNILLRGVPYGIGGPDTGRMGLPTLLPWETFFGVVNDPGKATDYKSWTAAIGETFLGAPGSVLDQTLQGGMELVTGNAAAGLTKITPKAFGLNDAIRALTYATQGVKDSRGFTYVPPTDVTFTQSVIRALGFEPAEIARAKEDRRRFFKEDTKIDYNRKELMSEFAEAQRARDYDARDAALKKIKEFNKKNPRDAITRSGLLASLSARRTNEQLVERLGVVAKSPGERARLRAIQEL